MTREFIESLIPETVENRASIVDAIVKEGGKDITREQKKFADYDTLKTDLATAQTTIADLKKSAGDTETLKATIKRYEDAEATRVENEAKNAKQREIAQRFATVRGAAKFVEPEVEEAVMAKFGAALSDEAYKGKGDAEIYAALTKDKKFFESQNPPVNMGGLGDTGALGAVTPEQFAKMGMRERSELQTKQPELYTQLVNLKRR